VRPSREQLDNLTPLERASFELANLMAHKRLTVLSKAYLSVVMGSMIWSCGGRRLNVRGLSNLAPFGKDARVLIVANHKSFFDFFLITALLFWRTKLSKRVFFPVRSTFFYDNPVGPLVNLTMSGMRMFPPVMRDDKKRQFNQWSVDRLCDELRHPGTVVAIHPEGTRNKSDDPYAFLPAQPGAGRVALSVPEAVVIPVFVLGMGNALHEEFAANWTSPSAHPIDVYFGAPVDLSDLRGQAPRAALFKRASDRCMDAIRALANEHRQGLGLPPLAPPSRRSRPSAAPESETDAPPALV
jgi:1-acyl-sn-glycerol-3-phosphate acyltransferase